MNQKSRSFATALAISVVALVALSGGAASAQTPVTAGFNLFSADQDVEIGRESTVEAERQLPVLKDPSIAGYVDRIGRRLAAVAPGPKFPYTFKVINVSDINAFALPGGPVYVTRGIIDAVRNEGELAGVMAHEISHVALRHGTNQASKAYLAKAGIGLLGGILGGGGTAIMQAVGGLGLNALFLRFSRTAESQADIMGTQIMARAGYNPLAMASMLSMLREKQGRDPGRVAQFFSDHPSPANREARVRQEAQALGAVRTTAPIGGLESVQAQLRRMPRTGSMSQISQGAAQGSGSPSTGPVTGAGEVGRIERPSTSFRLFRQRNDFFQIQYPNNWEVAEPENGYGVTILPPGGAVRASNGQHVLVYGVVVNHYEPFEGSIGGVFSNRRGPVSGNTSLEHATNDLVNQIRESNPHLAVIPNSTRRETIDQGRALSVMLGGRSPVTGADERVTVFTRELPDGHVLYALFVAPAQDYSVLSQTFQTMVSSLRVNDEAAHTEHAH
jgi:Zn-dependent protease with chaperone function